MKISKKLPDEEGFTLIESIIVVTLVLLGVSGIMTGWHLIESKERSLGDYWQRKETLELAYQVTHQTLRTTAKLSTISISNGHTIAFTGTDGLSRAFLWEDNDYKFISDGKEEVLIEDVCDSALFVLDGPLVRISLSVSPQPGWSGKADLDIGGTVFIRNQ